MREKDMQEHEETLGQVLHVLRHRARDVHEAEHDGLGHGLRHVLEATKTQVDRIEVGHAPAAHLDAVKLLLQRSQVSGIGAPRLEGCDRFLEFLDVLRRRTA
jgi:hypothetical protein